MSKLYVVKFNDNPKKYIFKYKDNLIQNDKVIVETEKGLQYASVVSEINNDTFKKHKNILRIATEEDYQNYLNNLKEAKEAISYCEKLVEELDLKMKLISSSYTLDKKQLLFTYYADSRVDFRELAKKLAYKYRTRIELRQIGYRDKAKTVGGIGMCGEKLCCARFLTHPESISINMAKNQGVPLNPTKINGLCGHLLCCLSYEDEAYEDLRKRMPSIGKKVKVNKKTGVVISQNLLKQTYVADINGEEVEVDLNETSKK